MREMKVCQICGCKLETEVMLLGRSYVVPCACNCIKANIESPEELERRRRLNNAKVLRNLKSYYLDNDMYSSFTFQNDDGLDVNNILASKSYVMEWQHSAPQKGNGFVFTGLPGTGKTFAAACISNELLRLGYACGVVSLPNLIDKMLQGKSDDVIKSVTVPDLLTIDDIGVEASSELKLEKTYQIVNSRYCTGKSTIYTTNISYKELKEPYSICQDRIYRRVLARNVVLRFGVRREE